LIHIASCRKGHLALSYAFSKSIFRRAPSIFFYKVHVWFYKEQQLIPKYTYRAWTPFVIV
jgi:hypothetical protein